MPSDTTYAPHIPDAVRRASLRADELARQAGVANVPPAEGEGADDGVTTVVSDPPQFELTPPEPEPPPPPPPAPPPEEDWQQRYNTLQGKYNTEIPELRGQIRSLQDLLANMQPRAPEPPPPPPPTMPARREIPREDVEAYGEDLINGVQRWAEARVAPMFQEFE